MGQIEKVLLRERGTTWPRSIKGLIGPRCFRGWWFTLAFLCIGLDTKFKDLAAMGAGKPAAAFLIAQAFNIVWTLIFAYLIFGGVLFPIPTF